MTDTNARQIELTINHPDNQLLKEVRQRVEEEVRLRQESDKRAEEEKRRVEELEHQLAEFKAQLAHIISNVPDMAT